MTSSSEGRHAHGKRGLAPDRSCPPAQGTLTQMPPRVPTPPAMVSPPPPEHQGQREPLGQKAASLPRGAAGHLEATGPGQGQEPEAQELAAVWPPGYSAALRSNWKVPQHRGTGRGGMSRPRAPAGNWGWGRDSKGPRGQGKWKPHWKSPDVAPRGCQSQYAALTQTPAGRVQPAADAEAGRPLA